MEAELPQDTPARPGHGPQSGELAKWQRAEEDGCAQRALAEAPGTPAVGRRAAALSQGAASEAGLEDEGRVHLT